MLAKCISPKWGFAFLLTLFSLSSFAQRIITGIVTAANNQPASGATVTVTGTNVATQTNAEGNFSISVPQGRNSLTVTYVGFENRTIDIGSNSSVSVSLTAASTSLSEVVVTGYTAQRRKDVT